MVGSDVWWHDAMEELEAARSLKAMGKKRQAYHHAGQAVEFALKAIYIKRKGLKSLPEDCKGAKWHSLPHIATHAGIDGDVRALHGERARYENWLVVRDWNSNARFPGNAPSNRDLNDLFLAVCHEKNGIMVWLRTIYLSI
jgi:hypothetical protein